jgi:exopolysaccharide production protein ExoZ
MKTKLLTIQSFRGIAAMLVVLFHLAPTTLKYFHYLSFNDVFSFGWMGVDFFFVLSGFIITYIHYNDIQQPKGNWGTFLKKRFIRIFPIYWFVLTLMFLIYVFLMKGQVHDEFVFNVHSPAHWFYLFRQYLLLPGDDYLVGVAWSLSFELLFYLVFAICIITGLKVARAVGILWFILIVVKYFTNTPILPGFLFSTCIVEFLIGCVIGYMIKAGKFFNLKRAYPLFLFILTEGLIIYFDGHSLRSFFWEAYPH